MAATVAALLQAKEQERDNDAIAAALLASLLFLVPRLRDAALQALADHADIATALAKVAEDYLPHALVNGALTAHAMAQARSITAAAPLLEEYGFTAGPGLPTAAELLPVYMPLAVKEVATLLLWFDKEVTAATAGIEEPAERLRVGRERLEALGLRDQDPFSLQSAIYTITHRGYVDGVRDVGRGTGMRAILLGWEYVSQRDKKVRPAHVKFDGQFCDVGDDVMWETFQDHFEEPNCRCFPVPIFGKPGTRPVLV